MERISHNNGSEFINAIDIALLRESRRKSKYDQLTAPEKSVYVKIHQCLRALGTRLQQKLGSEGHYHLKLTSGFDPRTGVRGFLPKDLWFAVYHQRNIVGLVGNPQLFMIVSHRGIECGFAASIHPARFSKAAARERVRSAAPRIFSALPEPGSNDAIELQRRLESADHWYFRKRARLRPNIQDFPSLDSWLAFLKSPAGAHWAAGCISRYLSAQDLDGRFASQTGLVDDMAETFASLMTILVPPF
jgi:hypothetical protein